MTCISYCLHSEHDPLVPGTVFCDRERTPAQRAESAAVANILRALDDASRPEDMNLPGFRFHTLVGRDKGRYAVNASENWRITFGWIEGEAIEVDLEDYH